MDLLDDNEDALLAAAMVMDSPVPAKRRSFELATTTTHPGFKANSTAPGKPYILSSVENVQAKFKIPTNENEVPEKEPSLVGQSIQPKSTSASFSGTPNFTPAFRVKSNIFQISPSGSDSELDSLLDSPAQQHSSNSFQNSLKTDPPKLHGLVNKPRVLNLRSADGRFTQNFPLKTNLDDNKKCPESKELSGFDSEEDIDDLMLSSMCAASEYGSPQPERLSLMSQPHQYRVADTPRSNAAALVSGSGLQPDHSAARGIPIMHHGSGISEGRSTVNNAKTAHIPNPRVAAPVPQNTRHEPAQLRSGFAGGGTQPCGQFVGSELGDVQTPQHNVLHGSSTAAKPQQVAASGSSVQHNSSLDEWQSPLSTSSTSKSRGAKRKRKFPGPAGLLPKLAPDAVLPSGGNDQNCLAEMASPNTKQLPSPSASQLTSSQSTDIFSDLPWQALCKDLQPQAAHILSKYTLRNIPKQVTRKLLPKGKVPLVSLVITTIDVQNADASVLVRDKTGEMRGTLHRQLVKEYGHILQVGTALLLRQVGAFSPTGRNHYLNITPNNVVCVYSRAADGELKTQHLGTMMAEDFVPPLLQPAATPQRQGSSGTPGQNPAGPNSREGTIWGGSARARTPAGSPNIYRPPGPTRANMSSPRFGPHSHTASSHSSPQFAARGGVQRPHYPNAVQSPRPPNMTTTPRGPAPRAPQVPLTPRGQSVRPYAPSGSTHMSQIPGANAVHTTPVQAANVRTDLKTCAPSAQPYCNPGLRTNQQSHAVTPHHTASTLSINSSNSVRVTGNTNSNTAPLSTPSNTCSSTSKKGFSFKKTSPGTAVTTTSASQSLHTNPATAQAAPQFSMPGELDDLLIGLEDEMLSEF